MNEDDTNIPPITKNATLQNIATHISYLRRDVKENRIAFDKGIEEVKKEIHDIRQYHVNNDEFKLYQQYGDARQKQIDDLRTLTEDYATIRRLVYGAVGVILLGFLYALVNYIIPNAHV